MMEYLLENEDSVVSAPRKSNVNKRVFKDPTLSIISNVTDDNNAEQAASVEHSSHPFPPKHLRPFSSDISKASAACLSEPNPQQHHDRRSERCVTFSHESINKPPPLDSFARNEPQSSYDPTLRFQAPHHTNDAYNSYYSNSNQAYHRPHSQNNMLHERLPIPAQVRDFNSYCRNACCASKPVYSSPLRSNSYHDMNGHVPKADQCYTTTSLHNNRRLSDHRLNEWTNDSVFDDNKGHPPKSPLTDVAKHSNDSTDVLQVILQQLKNQDQRLNSMQQQMLHMNQVPRSSHSEDFGYENGFNQMSPTTEMMILRTLHMQSTQMQKLQEQMNMLLMNLSPIPSDERCSTVPLGPKLKSSKSRKSIEAKKSAEEPSEESCSPISTEHKFKTSRSRRSVEGRNSIPEHSPTIQTSKQCRKTDVTKTSTSTMTSMILEGPDKIVMHKELLVVKDVTKQHHGDTSSTENIPVHDHVTPVRESQKHRKSSGKKNRRSSKDDSFEREGNATGSSSSKSSNSCEKKKYVLSPSSDDYLSPKDDKVLTVSSKRRQPLVDAKQKSTRIIDEAIPEDESAILTENYTSPKQIAPEKEVKYEKAKTKQHSTQRQITPVSSEKNKDPTNQPTVHYQDTEMIQMIQEILHQDTDNDSDTGSSSSVPSSPNPAKRGIVSELSNAAQEYLERYKLKSMIGDK